jgi:hypothetical protein
MAEPVRIQFFAPTPQPVDFTPLVEAGRFTGAAYAAMGEAIGRGLTEAAKIREQKDREKEIEKAFATLSSSDITQEVEYTTAEYLFPDLERAPMDQYGPPEMAQAARERFAKERAINDWGMEPAQAEAVAASAFKVQRARVLRPGMIDAIGKIRAKLLSRGVRGEELDALLDSQGIFATTDELAAYRMNLASTYMRPWQMAQRAQIAAETAARKALSAAESAAELERQRREIEARERLQRDEFAAREKLQKAEYDARWKELQEKLEQDALEGYAERKLESILLDRKIQAEKDLAALEVAAKGGVISLSQPEEQAASFIRTVLDEDLEPVPQISLLAIPGIGGPDELAHILGAGATGVRDPRDVLQQITVSFDPEAPGMVRVNAPKGIAGGVSVAGIEERVRDLLLRHHFGRPPAVAVLLQSLSSGMSIEPSTIKAVYDLMEKYPTFQSTMSALIRQASTKVRERGGVGGSATGVGVVPRGMETGGVPRQTVRMGLPGGNANWK